MQFSVQDWPWPSQVLLKLDRAFRSLGVCDSANVKWSLKIYVSDKFPGEASVGGPGPTGACKDGNRPKEPRKYSHLEFGTKTETDIGQWQAPEWRAKAAGRVRLLAAWPDTQHRSKSGEMGDWAG